MSAEDTGMIEDLQARIAFQEDALRSLNEVIIKQNLEIQNLQKQLQLLYKRVDDLKYELEQGNAAPDSPPPHY